MSDEILIYSDIGPWGFSAQEFAAKIPETGNVTVRVNSPGGDVFDGITISNRLWNRSSTVYIDGLAASSASIIAAGGRHVVAGEGAMLMIHEPWARVDGNAEEMAQEAAVLNKVGDQLAGIYARKAGGTVAEWRKRMAKETWLSASEAKELGLVDEISQSLSIAACAGLDRYNYQNKGRYMDIFNEKKVLALTETVEAKEAEIIALRASIEEATKKIEELAQEATAAKVEAEAKATEVDEVKATLQSERDGVEARITEAARDAVRAALKGNAPPVVEGGDGDVEQSHSAKHAALFAAGKLAEANAYMAKHRASIFRGE
jgi:ATP-dependent protease ClpP protease subunit